MKPFNSMTLSELGDLLVAAIKSPKAFFGREPDATLSRVLAACHPDRYPKNQDESTHLFTEFSKLFDTLKTPPVQISSKEGTYLLQSVLATGDVSDIHRGSAGGMSVLLKIARFPAANNLLHKEFEAIKALRKADTSRDGFYCKSFPKPIDSFQIKGSVVKRVCVYDERMGYRPLTELKQAFPKGLEGVHLAWIYNRLLAAVGFMQLANTIHGAVIPPNILYDPFTHGIMIIDLKTAGPPSTIKLISKDWKEFYAPEILKKQETSLATDIHMATKAVVWLAGGVPNSDGGIGIPESVPRPMAGFFAHALMGPSRMRPDNVWKFLDEFRDMLQALYGNPKWHDLPEH